ncbi:hypothetical protein T08_14188 [Trichinella sp. T8]|nr:hypothetical protein T08_14188 [Trichinella sp. T8]
MTLRLLYTSSLTGLLTVFLSGKLARSSSTAFN